MIGVFKNIKTSGSNDITKRQFECFLLVFFIEKTSKKCIENSGFNEIRQWQIVVFQEKTSGSDDAQSTPKGIENINSVLLIISNRSLSFMQYICSKAARTG
ncbi:MAG: hypothetical protein COB98_08235, partial [Flavobacteriaceae bacterium]